jgi:ubiquinol-cytochrome c reductase iron-sulfur subunit
VSAFKPSAKAEAAGAPVKVDVSKLLPGEMMTIEWRGKPVFVVSIPEENTNFITKNLERLADPDMEDPSQPGYAKNEIRSRKKRDRSLDWSLYTFGLRSKVLSRSKARGF